MEKNILINIYLYYMVKNVSKARKRFINQLKFTFNKTERKDIDYLQYLQVVVYYKGY